MIFRFISITCCLSLIGCVQRAVVDPKSLYQATSEVELNQARVYSEVLPMRGEEAVNAPQLIYSSSTAEFQGPLKWRFVAEGEQGQHLSMEIKQVQIETSKSKRRVVINSNSLGGVRAFQLDKSKGEQKPKGGDAEEATTTGKPNPHRWVASYEIPSVLQLFPAADGKIVVAAKIKVSTVESSETEWVNFAIQPTKNTAQALRFRRTMIEFDGVPIH